MPISKKAKTAVSQPLPAANETVPLDDEAALCKAIEEYLGKDIYSHGWTMHGPIKWGLWADEYRQFIELEKTTPLTFAKRDLLAFFAFCAATRHYGSFEFQLLADTVVNMALIGESSLVKALQFLYDLRQHPRFKTRKSPRIDTILDCFEAHILSGRRFVECGAYGMYFNLAYHNPTEFSYRKKYTESAQAEVTKWAEEKEKEAPKEGSGRKRKEVPE